MKPLEITHAEHIASLTARKRVQELEDRVCELQNLLTIGILLVDELRRGRFDRNAVNGEIWTGNARTAIGFRRRYVMRNRRRHVETTD